MPEPSFVEQRRAMCEWCARGKEPALIDEDYVLSILSGKPGEWSHAGDDYWWPCGAASIMPNRVHPAPWFTPPQYRGTKSVDCPACRTRHASGSQCPSGCRQSLLHRCRRAGRHPDLALGSHVSCGRACTDGLQSTAEQRVGTAGCRRLQARPRRRCSLKGLGIVDGQTLRVDLWPGVGA